MECARRIFEGEEPALPRVPAAGSYWEGLSQIIEDAAADWPQLPAVWVERLIGQEALLVLEMTPPVAAGYAIRRHFDLLYGDDLPGHDGCLP
jgi:hypothetical protein